LLHLDERKKEENQVYDEIENGKILTSAQPEPVLVYRLGEMNPKDHLLYEI